MTSEETPLLRGDGEDDEHLLVYSRFGLWKKRSIVALVSCSGLIPLFVAGTFIPSIPQIAKDLSTTPESISLTISLSIFGAAMGSMTMATYSGYYGRRFVYLSSLPFFCLGSYKIAVANDVYWLMFWRLVQAIGTSGGMSVGAAVIGDIYKLEERGLAMGIFFSVSLLGPALAPVAGGIATHYASWRALQWCFLFYGLGLFAGIALWLPETSHPGSLGAQKATIFGSTEACDSESSGIGRRRSSGWRWVWLNPFKCLGLLQSPNLLLVTLAGTTVLLTNYVLLVPLTYTIGAKYGITNEALIGAVFIPAGVGNMAGAPIAGYISDRKIVQWRSKRGGVWYPEDRLRATLFGAAFFAPLSVLLTGCVVHWVDERKLGIGLCLVCLFMNGIGIELVLSPVAAYNVDTMHARSAEAMAANSGFRALLISVTVSSILPLIKTYGVLFTNALSALIACGGLGMLVFVIRYGEELRGWKDVGYSTAQTN